MKVLAQTKFTPIVTVYDSAASDSVIGKYVKRIVQPVISVQADDGTELYSTGEFYESNMPIVAGVIGLIIFGLIVRRIL